MGIAMVFEINSMSNAIENSTRRSLVLFIALQVPLILNTTATRAITR